MSVRPIIRQFGSKTRVAQQILALLPPGCQTWVEVFCGTAAVTIAKPAAWHKDEHVNDLNGDIVNVFRVLRDPAQRARLCELIALTPWAEAEYREARDIPLVGEPVEDARRYLIRSWQGMAGASTRRTSWISIDHGTKRRPEVWHNLPNRVAILADRFAKVALHQKPAIDMVRRFGRYDDAVLFLDPPYPTGSIDTHDRSMYAVEMTDAEHAELATVIRAVKARVVMTMASGTFYDEALKDWWTLPLKVRGLHNNVKLERLFFNYDPAMVGLFAHHEAANE